MKITEDRMKHCLEVANKMKHFASSRCEKYDNANEMFVLGFLHDVGYEFSDKQEDHAQNGGEILKEQRYKYWKEVYYHGYPQNEYISKELALLNYADMTTGPRGENMSVDERIKDIKIRYGENSYQALAAKELADSLRQVGFY